MHDTTATEVEALAAIDKLITSTDAEPASDPVNSPRHYRGQRWELIEILEDLGLVRNGYLMQAVQYVFRHHRKGTPRQDLKKAIWYVKRSLTHPVRPVYEPLAVTSIEVVNDFGLPVDPFATVLTLLVKALRNPAAPGNYEGRAIELLERHLDATVFPGEAP